MAFGTPRFSTATKDFLNDAWLLSAVAIFVTEATLI
jgi:hypothetical protein